MAASVLFGTLLAVPAIDHGDHSGHGAPTAAVAQPTPPPSTAPCSVPGDDTAPAPTTTTIAATTRTRANTSATLPTWSVNDRWTYRRQIRIGLGATDYVELTDDSDRTMVDVEDHYFRGETYPCYRLTQSGNVVGSARFTQYGFNFFLTISGTLSGEMWLQRGDLSVVHESRTITGTATMNDVPYDFELQLNTSHDPPLEDYDFPLAAGEDWETRSELGLEGVITVQPFIDAQPFSSSVMTNLSCSCPEAETISDPNVLSGTPTPTFRVEELGTTDEGTANTTLWYAPDAKWYAMSETNNEGDTQDVRIESASAMLTSYWFAPQSRTVTATLTPARVGPGASVNISGIASDPYARIDVDIPINERHWSTTAGADGSYALTISAPSAPDATPTTTDMGSHGVIVTATLGPNSAWTTATLELIGPDLIVEDDAIAINATLPTEGDPVRIEVTIHNSPAAAVENITITCAIGDLTLENQTIVGIGQGREATVAFEWITTGGTHTIAVGAVLGMDLPEQNLTNNHASATLTVNRRPSAVIQLSQPTALTDEPIVISAAQSQDPDNDTLEYRFDFGDGTAADWSSSPNTTHQYPDGPAAYTISVSVRDEHGALALPGPAARVNISILNRAPVVEADYGVGPGADGKWGVTINASASTDPDGTVEAFRFAFGDGTETGWQPSALTEHVYATLGSFPITVSVRDDDGASATESSFVANITNRIPHLDLRVSSIHIQTGESVTVFATGTDDDPITYHWDFESDGVFDLSGAASTTEHEFEDNGVYRITVRVTDSYGAYTQATTPAITVANRPPTATTHVSAVSVTSNATVRFTATALTDPDGTVEAYYWSFGDGSNRSLAETTHRYTRDGLYTASFVIIDDDGTETRYPISINVFTPDYPPVPVFTLSTTTAVPLQYIEFDATGSYDDNRIVAYNWSFGDGHSAQEPSVLHRYPSPGTYTVTLEVTDSNGAVNRTTRTLTIAPLRETKGEVGSTSEARNYNPSMNYLLIAFSVALTIIVIDWVVGYTREKRGKRRTNTGREEQQAVQTVHAPHDPERE